MTESEITNKICDLIRTIFADAYGSKTNQFIIDYSSLYNTIYERVCNEGFDLEKALENKSLT